MFLKLLIEYYVRFFNYFFYLIYALIIFLVAFMLITLFISYFSSLLLFIFINSGFGCAYLNNEFVRFFENKNVQKIRYYLIILNKFNLKSIFPIFLNIWNRFSYLLSNFLLNVFVLMFFIFSHTLLFFLIFITLLFLSA